MSDLARSGFQRFVDALNRSRDVAALHTAVTDDIRLDRYRPGERGTTTVAEAFTGFAEVVR